MMNIKSRVKKLFRRKPQGSIADVADILASLEREARNIAEQIFEVSLVNPPPRSREQIAQAAWVMFLALGEKNFKTMIANGSDPDIAASSTRSAADIMQETFLRRYDELVTHGNHGSGGRH
jgi:hypothetical protein